MTDDSPAESFVMDDPAAQLVRIGKARKAIAIAAVEERAAKEAHSEAKKKLELAYQELLNAIDNDQPGLFDEEGDGDEA